MYEHLAFVLLTSRNYRFVESVSLLLNADCLLITKAARVCQINPPLLRISEAGSRGGRGSTYYRVTIKERYKVRLHCDPIKSPGEFLSLLEAHQIWSI